MPSLYCKTSNEMVYVNGISLLYILDRLSVGKYVVYCEYYSEHAI